MLAAAQPFGVGVKLGSTLNNAITATSTLSVPDDHHFIVGPYFEVRLPFGSRRSSTRSTSRASTAVSSMEGLPGSFRFWRSTSC